MSSGVPKQVKTVKGALLFVRSDAESSITDPNPTKPLIFVFQYNPESLTHTFVSENVEETANQEEKRGVQNRIVEMITLNLELDATDQLEQPKSSGKNVKLGLHAPLAALESIMLCQSKTDNSKSSVLLFVWGSNRIIVVSLESVKILEEAFDVDLNPIRAKIELVMRVPDIEEFKTGSAKHGLCLAHLIRRNALAQAYDEAKMETTTYRDFTKRILRDIEPAGRIKKNKKHDIK